MALSRRTGARFQASIWPGFVDAMTGLLLVLMFVLTIFMVVQFALRETITGQASQLDELSAEVDALAQALGLERDRNATLSDRVGELTATLGDARARQDEQAALIDTLRSQTRAQAAELDVAQSRIASFEEQVAGLLAERDEALGQVSALEDERDTLISEQEAMQLALSDLRGEIDEQEEAARLAAARREALDALVADLRAEAEDSEAAQAALAQQVDTLETELSEEEQARLAEAAAAEALRERLQDADAELTAMTLALEEQRKRAEETLTLLAASEAAQDDLDARLAAALAVREEAEQELSTQGEQLAEVQSQLAEMDDIGDLRARLAAALAAKAVAETRAEDQLTEAEQRAALLAQAREKLSEQQDIASEAQKQQALLNRQVAALRDQLSQLQGLLDDAKAREAAADIQLQSLGNELNTALARVAAEERRRREAEEARARLLEAQNEDLERYRSEFFGRLRDVLGTREGIRIEGDRFVFSSEVLFAPGEADLSAAGQREIANVAGILRDVIDEIPSGIDWVLQVDGHTDDVPVRPGAAFADNWELSQARALSVVRYMVNTLGLPPAQLSANGFGEYQPVNPADTAEARAQNRRIELKFTGK
ncbi:peptidoglycan -binding protein [Roseovarius gahaiensis]|uniref:Peptidoglycan -binding protein n=1 Tax=Roseovarius gahaiensis TaxID=2716691 RepID=A0A967BGX6_9RHOB|nr:peptidoglycan -binding protein [Roseovarius gahaiensis]NHQ74608.1 peptidoglycan -binding protein [Roseovarius gahaiensis]